MSDLTTAANDAAEWAEKLMAAAKAAGIADDVAMRLAGDLLGIQIFNLLVYGEQRSGQPRYQIRKVTMKHIQAQIDTLYEAYDRGELLPTTKGTA